MADMEFDLGEAVGGYEQAKADRDFYLNMIDMGRENKGAFMASPIAAYLYGVSNVKMANMRAKAQNIQDRRQADKDALAAAEKAQQRQTNIDNQIVQLVKGARDGSIPPAVAATMLGPLMKEKGLNLKQFDADRSVLIGNEPGDTEDFEWDLSEAESSKGQRELQKLYLQQAAEDRRAKAEERKEREAESINKYREALAEKARKGIEDKGHKSKTNEFIKANKDLFDNVFEPKSAIMKRLSLEERLSRYVGNDSRILNKWLRGIKELDADSQEIFGEQTALIQDALDAIQNPKGAALVSNEATPTSKSSAIDLLRARWNKSK